MPGVLYTLAAVILLIRIGESPPFAHNWETYAAWRFFSFWDGPGQPTRDVLALSDGLMTDSGRGPIMGALVWLGFALGDVELGTMRAPVALIAAAAVPLLWLVGQRIGGPWVAGLAAVLLALSPVYLLYGRTATLVGISLVPALLTMLALIHLVEETDRSKGREAIAWLVALQLFLVIGAYAYAPVRLLWPISVGLLAITVMGDRAWRGWRLIASVITIITLPLALAAIEEATAPHPDPVGAVTGYFNVRDEQVWSLRQHPERYQDFLRTPTGDAVEGAPVTLAARLAVQNSGDLARLVLDRETLPTWTDHWNAHGRLWPALMAPFCGIGLAVVAWGAIAQRRRPDLILLALTAGLLLPLLLTTRVHIGRMVPSLPLLLFMVARGWFVLVAVIDSGLSRLVTGWPTVRLSPIARIGVVLMTVGFVALIGRSTWRNAQHAPPMPREQPVIEALARQTLAARDRGSAALIADPTLGLEIEGVHAATYRLALDDRYRFVDLTGRVTADSPAGDGRPPLYVVGALDRVRDGSLPDLCDNLYLVAPNARESFFSALGTDGTLPGCSTPVRYVGLPE